MTLQSSIPVCARDMPQDDCSSPFAIAQLCKKLGLIPVPTRADNPRHYAFGKNTERGHQYTDGEWNWRLVGGCAVLLGPQSNGFTLVRIDLDHHDGQDAPAAFAYTRTALGGDLFGKMPWKQSTSLTGYDGLFLTALPPQKTQCEIYDGDGSYIGEALTTNLFTVPPLGDSRWIQGDIRSIPVLSDEETRIIYQALHIQEAQPVPEKRTNYQPLQRTDTLISDGDVIGDYNCNTDLPAWFESKGARLSKSTSTYISMHCIGKNHKHGDQEPSLLLKPSKNPRNGAYIASCQTVGCEYHGYHHAFECYSIWNNLDRNDTLKAVAPLPSRPQRINPGARHTAHENEAIDTQRTADRQRKEQARDETRAPILDAIRGQIEQDKTLSKKALQLGLLLLRRDVLGGNDTNKDLSAELECSPRTITNAFTALKGKYLERNGGYGNRNHATSTIPAVWRWIATDTSKVAKTLLSTELHPDTSKVAKSSLFSTVNVDTSKVANGRHETQESSTLLVIKQEREEKFDQVCDEAWEQDESVPVEPAAFAATFNFLSLLVPESKPEIELSSEDQHEQIQQVAETLTIVDPSLSARALVPPVVVYTPEERTIVTWLAELQQWQRERMLEHVHASDLNYIAYRCPDGYAPETIAALLLRDYATIAIGSDDYNAADSEIERESQIYQEAMQWVEKERSTVTTPHGIAALDHHMAALQSALTTCFLQTGGANAPPVKGTHTRELSQPSAMLLRARHITQRRLIAR